MDSNALSSSISSFRVIYLLETLTGILLDYGKANYGRDVATPQLPCFPEICSVQFRSKFRSTSASCQFSLSPSILYRITFTRGIIEPFRAH